jgi:hypothetical protein
VTVWLRSPVVIVRALKRIGGARHGVRPDLPTCSL